MMLKSDMGPAEYLRRSGELPERGRSESPVRGRADAAQARRGTPMPDRFVGRRSQSERRSPRSLPEEEQPAPPPSRHASGPAPAAVSALRRQGSDASGRSTASAGNLLDTGLEGLPPARQAWMVQCVVGDIAAEGDWLALAVYLAVAGQYMTTQVGDVALGPVRLRLADHIQTALRQLAAGAADGFHAPSEEGMSPGQEGQGDTSSHESAHGLRAGCRHICCGGKGKFVP